MKLLKISLLIFPFLIVSFQVFGIEVAQFESSDLKDSLVIQKNGPQNQFVINTGSTVKLWTQNDVKVKGEFISFDGFAITLNIDGLALRVPINEIEKVKCFGNTGVQILGTVILVAGVGLMAVAGSGILVGLTILASGQLISPVVFVAAVAFGGLGFALYKGGDAIVGRKVNLKRGWSIIAPL